MTNHRCDGLQRAICAGKSSWEETRGEGSQKEDRRKRGRRFGETPRMNIKYASPSRSHQENRKHSRSFEQRKYSAGNCLNSYWESRLSKQGWQTMWRLAAEGSCCLPQGQKVKGGEDSRQPRSGPLGGPWQAFLTRDGAVAKLSCDQKLNQKNTGDL